MHDQFATHSPKKNRLISGRWPDGDQDLHRDVGVTLLLHSLRKVFREKQSSDGLLWYDHHLATWFDSLTIPERGLLFHGIRVHDIRDAARIIEVDGPITQCTQQFFMAADRHSGRMPRESPEIPVAFGDRLGKSKDFDRLRRLTDRRRVGCSKASPSGLPHCAHIPHASGLLLALPHSSP